MSNRVRVYISSKTIVLLFTSVVTFACNADEILDTNQEPAAQAHVADTGPRHRTARNANVHCYESFGKFKRAMAKRGLRSKHNMAEWHHIVGQHNDNKVKFGEYDLHCTDNIILLSKKQHSAINGHYARSRKRLGDQSLRDWLKPMDFEQQYTYGIQALEREGVTWTWIE